MNKILLDSDLLKQIIGEYYRQHLDINPSVEIGKKCCDVGYEMMSTKTCVIDFQVTYDINIGGSLIPMKTVLDSQELKDIISWFIAQSDDLELVSYEFDSGVRNVTEGYYMSERTTARPYFNGINVCVKRKSHNLTYY